MNIGPVEFEKATLRWTPFLERRFMLAASTIGAVLVLGSVLLWFHRLTGGEFVMLVGGVIGGVISAYYGAKGWDKHVEARTNGKPDPGPVAGPDIHD